VRLVLVSLIAGVSLIKVTSGSASIGFLLGATGLSVRITEENGTNDVQAGSHPYVLTVTTEFQPAGGFGADDPRDLSLEMPPGLTENPTAVPTCSQVAFLTPRNSPFEASRSGESCPDRTQLGTLTLRSSYGGGEERTFGLFNLQAPPGAPSELGANPYGAPIVFVPQLRQSEGAYRLTLGTHNLPQLFGISGLTLRMWGKPGGTLGPKVLTLSEPGEKVYTQTYALDNERGNCLNETDPAAPFGEPGSLVTTIIEKPGEEPEITTAYFPRTCSVPQNPTPEAYLTLPTSCEGPLSFTAVADSWQGGPPATRATTAAGLGECQTLAFEPRPFGQLSDPRTTSPSGYVFEIGVDDSGVAEPARRSPSAVRRAVVALPAGVTINPSVGAGLGVCAPAQFEAETATSPPGAGCPNESKIGDFQVKSPIVAGPVEGSMFLAEPYHNPSGSLIAIYLVAKSIQRGVLVKVAGKLEADPTTGRLTAIFDRLPQLPYSSLIMHFREGQRSPLATPGSCGPHSTATELSAWRDPGLVRRTESTVAIEAGIGGGPCPQGTPPFVPQASGGMLNSHAGAYSPFYLHLTRTDPEQEITRYSATLPPGLLGKIAGIPFCPDAAIDAASHRGGVEELEHPDCPAASKIGHTIAGYGVGSVLTYAPGDLYLAGPYHGSTFSVVAIDSALVGPFDLGVVIVRSAIHVDPASAQVSIDSAGSDPIPHIIDGIPIHLRDIRVHIDRPETTINPTSCESSALASTLNGSGAASGDPADDTTATASSPFQAFDCGSLGFRPRLSLRLRGGTRRGTFPSLRVEVRPSPGDANIASAQVALPPSVFLAQEHIGTICTRVQEARAACPPESVYGWAQASTPLLSEPLEGPVFLRSSDNLLPDLVASLRGGGIGIRVDLDGRIDSHKGGLRGTFSGIPDAPVSRFVMSLRGGRHGLLVNAANLCTRRQLANARFVGHAGRGVLWLPAVKARCRKKAPRHKHPKHHQRKGVRR
jgi:hypothetical protein